MSGDGGDDGDGALRYGIRTGSGRVWRRRNPFLGGRGFPAVFLLWGVFPLYDFGAGVGK